MTDKNRRLLSNALVDRSGQLRLLIPFIALLLIHLGSNIYIVRQISNTGMNDRLGAVEVSVLSKTITEVSFFGMFSSAVFTFSCFGFWIVYLHRIFGPMVPFRRKIESLLDGKHGAMVKLRRHDEFKYLADDLNKLAEKVRPADVP